MRWALLSCDIDRRRLPEVPVVRLEATHCRSESAKMSDKKFLRYYAPRGSEGQSTYFRQLLRETLGTRGWESVAHGLIAVDPRYIGQVRLALEKSKVKKYRWL